MIVGVPKELKNHEYRVAIVPAGVRTIVENGHKVIIQKSAGEGAGITDDEYVAAGAEIRITADAVFDEAEMIVKVKEPLASECQLLREGQLLLAYLHLAPTIELTKALLDRKIIGIAYETVQLDNGLLPLLSPMSEIAGKLSVQIGAHYLQNENGGSGVLLGGVPGVEQANVAVIGGGSVGTNAAKIALGMGAHVTVLDTNLPRLRYLGDVLHGSISLLASNSANVEGAVADADLVIGSLLTAGAKATKMVTRRMIAKMRPGSVVVDVAIDQGGCVETSVPTTHEKPAFRVEGVTHYCVANMPGCVARTSTLAFTNSTLPYILKLANLGYEKACAEDPALRQGVNVFKGKLTNRAVAEATGLEYFPYENCTNFTPTRRQELWQS